MTGTESDDLSGVQFTQVEISTGLGLSKSYWTGSTWTAAGSQTWITTTTAASWTYTLPPAALATGNYYYLRLQLTDFAGNVFVSKTSTFTYNTTAPTVTVVPLPPNNGFYSQVQISTPFAGGVTETAVIPVGISTVSLTIFDLTISSYFNGTTFGGSLVNLPAQGTVNSWTYANPALILTNNHQYNVQATAVDNAGNVGSVQYGPLRIRRSAADHHDHVAANRIYQQPGDCSGNRFR